MKLSNEELIRLMSLLMYIMQASILVPMVVVWFRWRHFSAPVRLLSWYVYLSLIGSALGNLLTKVMSNNYPGTIFFNTGKIVLFGAVYHQLLSLPRWRRLVLISTGATLVGIVCFWSTELSGLYLMSAISRVAQCALLAGFAIIYLEQTLNRSVPIQGSADPFWLLSVGQLVYSAATVTAFSLDYLSLTETDQIYKYILIALAGLVFNFFLTLAFIRAHRYAPSPPPRIPQPSAELAST